MSVGMSVSRSAPLSSPSTEQEGIAPQLQFSPKEIKTNKQTKREKKERTLGRVFHGSLPPPFLIVSVLSKPGRGRQVRISPVLSK